MEAEVIDKEKRKERQREIKRSHPKRRDLDYDEHWAEEKERGALLWLRSSRGSQLSGFRPFWSGARVLAIGVGECPKDCGQALETAKTQTTWLP